MFSANEGWSLQVHGGGNGIATLLNNLLTTLDNLPDSSGGADALNILLPGIAGMANIHPLVVHFPIALLVMFFGVELAAAVFKQAPWRTVASGLLYLGTLTAAIAVYFGLQAAETVAHSEAVHSIMEKHEDIGISVLGLALLLSFWRLFFKPHKQLGMQSIYLLCAMTLTILIALGADLGGLMVYHYGVSVNSSSNNQPPTESLAPSPATIPAHTHDHHHDHTGHPH
jgi:uncharacterized membrane protein